MLCFIKLNKSFFIKNTIKKINRQVIDLEKYSKNISDKVLVSRIYKLLQLSNKNIRNFIRCGQSLNRHSPKKLSTWPISPSRKLKSLDMFKLKLQ